MAKEHWDQVADSVEGRRLWADPQYNKVHGSGMGKQWLSLPTLAQHQLIDNILQNSNNTQATFGLGWIYDNNRGKAYMIASFKGASKDLETTVEGIARIFGMKLISLSNSTSGLHAEMQIMQFCVQNLGIRKYDLQYAGLQIMCVGKAVCVDCAGYMNKHNIPHLGVYKNKDQQKVVSDDHGGASTMGGGMWMNPLTGATYGGGKNVNYYSKPGRKTLHKPFY